MMVLNELVQRNAELERENARLRAALEKAEGALIPFSHSAFSAVLGGNVQGDDSPLWMRGDSEVGTSILYIRDFKRVQSVLAAIREVKESK